MKKWLPVVATLMLTVPVMADPLIHMDTDEGVLNVNSYEVHESKGGKYLFLLFDWTNGTNEAGSFLSNYLVDAYQNGKQVYTDLDVYYEPSGTDGFGGAQVKPGYSTTGYFGIPLTDYSEVEITVYTFENMFQEDPNEMTTIFIDPSETAPDSTATPQTEQVQTEQTEKEVDRITLLEEKVAELEARLEALENK
jgi:hypothetical protein